MNLFSAIFSVCFLILGSMVWMVGLMIVIVGAIGVLRIAVKWALEVDIIEWYHYRKKISQEDIKLADRKPLTSAEITAVNK